MADAQAHQTFREDLPNRPGSFVPNPLLTTNRGVGDLAAIENDNSAADSYAVSATGPGSGRVGVRRDRDRAVPGVPQRRATSCGDTWTPRRAMASTARPH